MAIVSHNKKAGMIQFRHPLAYDEHTKKPGKNFTKGAKKLPGVGEIVADLERLLTRCGAKSNSGKKACRASRST